MYEWEKMPTGLLHSAENLRSLIIEHPDLPLIVFSGENCNSGDYSFMSCSDVSATLGEFLDCRQGVNEDRVFDDREEFEEELEDHIYNEMWNEGHYHDKNADKIKESDAILEERVQSRMKEYAPYWKPCIIVYVDN